MRLNLLGQRCRYENLIPLVSFTMGLLEVTSHQIQLQDRYIFIS